MLVDIVVAYFRGQPPRQRVAAFHFFDRYRVQGLTDRASIQAMPRMDYQVASVQKSLGTRSRVKTFPGACRGEEDFVRLKALFGGLKRPRTANMAADNDGAFPTESYLQQELVKRLFESMVNLDSIIDKPAQVKSKGDNRTKEAEGRHHPIHPDPAFTYNSRVKGVWELSDFQLEMLAWELLFRIRDAQAGILRLDPWHADDHWQYSHYPNFMARFEACCVALRTSKAIVHNLTEAPYHARSALAPEAEVKRKRTNNQGNEKKGEQQRLGKQVQLAGQNPNAGIPPPMPAVGAPPPTLAGLPPPMSAAGMPGRLQAEDRAEQQVLDHLVFPSGPVMYGKNTTMGNSMNNGVPQGYSLPPTTVTPPTAALGGPQHYTLRPIDSLPPTGRQGHPQQCTVLQSELLYPATPLENSKPQLGVSPAPPQELFGNLDDTWMEDPNFGREQGSTVTTVQPQGQRGTQAPANMVNTAAAAASGGLGAPFWTPHTPGPEYPANTLWPGSIKNEPGSFDVEQTN